MATIEELREKYYNFAHYLGEQHPETKAARNEYENARKYGKQEE